LQEEQGYSGYQYPRHFDRMRSASGLPAVDCTKRASALYSRACSIQASRKIEAVVIIFPGREIGVKEGEGGEGRS
jgi:hypothetical protein